MTGSDEDELRRRFEAATAGQELDSLRELGSVDDRAPGRRPPLEGIRILRVRAELLHSETRIVRTLDLRSDTTLATVHLALQAAFGWSDSHLYRFALGGSPFDPRSELFLCPYDVDEGEDAGAPTDAVRADETLQTPGDTLQYVYDYGDSWILELRLTDVSDAPVGSPPAVCIAGEGPMPGEDGSMPTAFDLDGVNHALDDPLFHLPDLGFTAEVVALATRLRGTPQFAALLTGTPAPQTPEASRIAAATGAVRWFLDRARGGGIPLTAAGYLRPDDVEAASLVLPTMRDWIGKNNREVFAAPLLEFRTWLQAAGLLRKYRGRLLLTRLGAAAQRDPVALWDALVVKLVPTGAFAREATLVTLAHVAAGRWRAVPYDQIASTLGALGWRHSDGSPLDWRSLTRLGALELLRSLDEPAYDERPLTEFGPVATALAQAALRRSPG